MKHCANLDPGVDHEIVTLLIKVISGLEVIYGEEETFKIDPGLRFLLGEAKKRLAPRKALEANPRKL